MLYPRLSPTNYFPRLFTAMIFAVFYVPLEIFDLLTLPKDF